MKTSIFQKRLVTAMALAVATPLTMQTAMAAASFSSSATVTYTLENIVNLTHAGDLSGLGITGSSQLDPDQTTQFITGTGSVTPNISGLDTTNVSPAIGASYSKTFQLDSSASDSGTVYTNYLAWFGLGLNNTSSTDSYAIDLKLTYELHTSASADSAEEASATDVTLNYFDTGSGSFAGADYLSATDSTTASPLIVTPATFSFNLLPNATQNIKVDAGITGSLQSVAAVPVPSALWLFGSGLAGLLLRNRRKA